MKKHVLPIFIILCISTVALLFAHGNMSKATIGSLVVRFTSTVTGISTHGANIVSDTDGTDDLGTSSVRWNAVYTDEIIPNKGADVASVADGMTLGADGNFFDITGTTNLDSIAAQTVGKEVTLQFDGVLTVTDGGNLNLAGNFVTSADDILKLVTDGIDWWEISRSAN